MKKLLLLALCTIRTVECMKRLPSDPHLPETSIKTNSVPHEAAKVVAQMLKSRPLAIADRDLPLELSSCSQEFRTRVAQAYLIAYRENHPYFTSNVNNAINCAPKISVEDLINFKKCPAVQCQDGTVGINFSNCAMLHSLQGLLMVPNIDLVEVIFANRLQLTNINPAILQNLPHLKAVSVRNNIFKEETKSALREKFPQIAFHFN